MLKEHDWGKRRKPGRATRAKDGTIYLKNAIRVKDVLHLATVDMLLAELRRRAVRHG
jgi:hypothetical protein